MDAETRRRLEALRDQWRAWSLKLLQQSDGQGNTQYALRLAAEAEGIDRCVDQLDSTLAARPVAPPACAWQQVDEDDECWSTACQNEFSMSSEPPHDWMKFCCYCGGAVTLTPWTPTFDDDEDESPEAPDGR